MQKITANDPAAYSVDVRAENIDKLKTLFPELITEGAEGAAINVDVLKQLVGDTTVTDPDEKYGLNWHGKRRARQLALTPSTGTLRPCLEDSVDWDTTQNLMIEGDNLEVLKLLQKSYANKVKLIYIDPPYNTGKDFVYPDNFQDSIKNYLELTGQVEGGAKINSNTEASGRFHTDWLNMMYPRLKLARNMLQDDGLIVCSIDDAELANLTEILDEIFGTENEMAVLVWDRNRKNDAKFFSVGHEYMLVYAKNKQSLIDAGVLFREPKAGIEKAKELYARLRLENSDNWETIKKQWRDFFRALADSDPMKPLGRFTKVGPKGPYRDDGDISWPGGGGPKYEVLHPVTGRPCKIPAGGWVYASPETFLNEVENGRVVFGDDETTLPRQMRLLFEGDGQVLTSVNFSYAQTATMDFVELMGARVFDNPKYWEDIRRIIQYLTKRDDVVLDFFAGSGTTAHAVFEQNSVDQGARRVIVVQIPEVLSVENKDQKIAVEYLAKLRRPLNIAELTKERLRRARDKVKAKGQFPGNDTGFRVYKLDQSNIRIWQPRDDLEKDLIDNIEHIVAGRSEDDVLTELLLKLGLDLCVPIEQRQIAGKRVHAIGGGVLLACLDTSITAVDAEALALGIADWHQQLAPSGDTTCVFRDSAFADDVAKTNLAAILDQHGIHTVRSL